MTETQQVDLQSHSVLGGLSSWLKSDRRPRRNTCDSIWSFCRRISMGMMNNGLSYWQAETEGIDLLDLTLGDLLDQRAEEHPSHEAIVYSCYPEFGDGLNIRGSYQDYRNRANAVAKGLMSMCLQ